MSKKQSGASSVGGALGSALKEICYFLTILFCALRACGVINWSWFWVMSPIFLLLGAGTCLPRHRWSYHGNRPERRLKFFRRAR